jgi:hypothetical protein
MAMAVAVGLTSMISSAMAQSRPATKDQLKCQTGSAQSLAKFATSKAKCAQKCLNEARKTSGPYTGCKPPDYTDPDTHACIFDAQKGAEEKARARMAKGCTADCPTCYADVSLCDGALLVDAVEQIIDFIGPQVYCLEANDMSPTKQEAKCEDTVAKGLAKFLGVKAKCYQKCVTMEFKGKIPPNGCAAPSPSDLATQECIMKAETKVAEAIDKVCVTVPGNPPCYSPGMTGAGWAALGETGVDGAAPAIFCGSPSGAFVD